MTENLPESFDEIFGEGAVEAITAASTFTDENGNDDVPSVTEAVWDVDGQLVTWPPIEGRYIMMLAKWEFVEQPSYYSADGKSVYYGDGFCNAADEQINFPELLAQLQKMASANSDSSNTPYINWIFENGVENIYMKMPKQFQENFEIMGWDLDEADGDFVTMAGNTMPDGKVRRFLNWVNSEFSDDLKPEWIPE